jgi:polysaccharide pyruvyl transferase WcaK-like protein
LQAIGAGNFAPFHEHTVPALVEAIAGCRLVITASYHGAVLAIAQGIPAICLLKSAYYRAKFAGLAGLFPEGCTLIDAGTAEATNLLARSIEAFADSSRDLKPQLLDTRSALVAQSEKQYQRLMDLLPAVK